MTILTTILASISDAFKTTTPDGPTGADAVRTAISEIEGLRNKEFTAVLGEPDIVEANGSFFNDPKIVIPVLDAPYDGANQLVFDLPEGRDDPLSQFTELLEIFDLALEDLELLEGEKVPVKIFGGNAVVAWGELEDTGKGGDDETVNVTEETISTVENGKSSKRITTSKWTASVSIPPMAVRSSSKWMATDSR